MNSINTVAVKWFRSGYLIPAIILVTSIYFLTPRGWEPGGESWKAWAAARILADTGGFPVFSLNVLYVAYLTPFLKLPFPVSQNLEYWTTHLFALVSLFALVRTPLGTVKSLILVAALTPSLAIVEGGGTVAAIGFFSLYLRNYVTAKPGTWFFLPASLPAAALCHSAYWPFLVLHLLVSGFLWSGGRLRGTRLAVNYGRLPGKVLLLLLAALAVTAFLLQSGRIDNNHMLMDPRFAPIPLTSAINIGFFQISTWNLVERLYDPSVLATKDWYFETPKFFGNSRTILEVIRNDPGLFFTIIFKNTSYTVMLPLYFYSFFPLGYINVATISVSMLLLLMLLIGLSRIYRAHGVAALFILVVGSGGLLAAFLLTNFGLRYVITLLPIFLLAYACYLGDTECGTKIAVYENRSFKSGLFLLGCALMFGNAPFRGNSDRIANECAGDGNPVNFSYKQYTCRKLKKAIYQFRAAAHGEGFLKRGDGVSMKSTYQELSRRIDKSTRILSLEHTFFAGFTGVGLDNNRQIWSLPPYVDKTGYTDRLLNEIDIFFVSDDLARDEASMSTQAFLRYKLHILPYLNANKARFSTVHVPRYRDLYVRREREQPARGTSMNSVGPSLQVH